MSVGARGRGRVEHGGVRGGQSARDEAGENGVAWLGRSRAHQQLRVHHAAQAHFGGLRLEAAARDLHERVVARLGLLQVHACKN